MLTKNVENSIWESLVLWLSLSSIHKAKSFKVIAKIWSTKQEPNKILFFYYKSQIKSSFKMIGNNDEQKDNLYLKNNSLPIHRAANVFQPSESEF